MRIALGIVLSLGIVGAAWADEPCTKDADCAGDKVCIDGKCVLPPTEAPKPDEPKTDPVDPPKTDPVDPPKTDPAPRPGCGSDADCKGNRVCENGQCVEPKKTDPSEPVPPTTPPPEDTKNLKRRFVGSLSGGGGVTLHVKGTYIYGGTASVGGVTFNLSGKSILLGNRGRNDWVKLFVKYVKEDAKWVKGRYEGTVNNRRYNGTFSASVR